MDVLDRGYNQACIKGCTEGGKVDGKWVNEVAVRECLHRALVRLRAA